MVKLSESWMLPGMISNTNKAYSYVETNDGSISVYADEYGQTMHSVSGGYEEALYKHVIPSGVTTIQKDEINVLDVGFGLGYNILALLHCCDSGDRFSKIRIISLESDDTIGNLVREIRFNDEKDHVYDKVKAAAQSGEYNDGRIHITILFGDARHTLKSVKNTRFDTVFHDPFSPASNPELWSVEFFSLLNERMEPNAVLTTYSAALQVRMAMMEAGFIIGRGPSVGGKKEGTLATIGGFIEALDEDEMEGIRSDVRAIPYREKSGLDTREDLLNRRLEEMRVMKNTG